MVDRAKINMASDFFLAAFKVPRQENHTHNILGEERTSMKTIILC